MCAIAGEINLHRPPDDGLKARAERMLSTMGRRGPDQRGVFLTGCGSLIHARLSVIDLEKGRQPMAYQEGGAIFAIVYNGELYNTEEIRKELLLLGHTFQTRCDTEVALHAFMEWGEGCVSRFNGIFAFAVWDGINRRLFLARDRIGVKPLFFALRGETLVFASEIKTLLTHPLVPAELDINGIAELMLVGPGRTPGRGGF